MSFKPTSPYYSLDYFLDIMLTKFHEHGVQIDIYDSSAKDALEQINLYKTIDYDMVLAFNAMLCILISTNLSNKKRIEMLPCTSHIN